MVCAEWAGGQSSASWRGTSVYSPQSFPLSMSSKYLVISATRVASARLVMSPRCLSLSWVSGERLALTHDYTVYQSLTVGRQNMMRLIPAATVLRCNQGLVMAGHVWG